MGDGTNGVDDEQAWRILQQVTTGAGTHSLHRYLKIVAVHHHDDRGIRVVRLEQACCFHPVEGRHADIHEYDRWEQARHTIQRLPAIGRLSYHPQVGVVTQHRLQPGTHHRVVIDEHDGDGIHLKVRCLSPREATAFTAF